MQYQLPFKYLSASPPPASPSLYLNLPGQHNSWKSHLISISSPPILSSLFQTSDATVS